MKIGSAYPSTYLKAADLQGKRIKCIMDRVEIEDVGDGDKPVLYFQGKQKGLVLNKTNATTISEIYGDETEEWTGHTLELYTARVDFQGRRVDAIRVSVTNEGPQQRQPIQRTQTSREPDGRPVPPPNDPLDDEIPF